jgi:aminoglycoside phosphotransferase (APT) family kinase protein
MTDNAVAQELPDGMTEWVAAVGDGRITRLERHIARREAWVVDVEPETGASGTREYFLRLDRSSAQAESPWSVKKEARVVDALHRAGLPVPAVHGCNEELQAAVFERVPGREDLYNETTPEQCRTIWEQFMRFVVDMHALERTELDLEDVLTWPDDAREAALHEVDELERLMGGDVIEPLATFGASWLRRHVPESVDRIVLLQGDTGPGNFLFEDDRVTAVVDFEWAHYGDPMEDFGNMAVREFFYPSANLAEVFPLYEKFGGGPVDYDRVRYYRVHQMVRSVIALYQMTTLNDPTTAVALNLCYRVICDRATCEAIADAMHIELDRPDPIGEPPALAGHTIGEVAVDNLRRQVLPAVDDEWATHQLEHATLLVECMDRLARLGPAVDAVEVDELTELLGERPASTADGLARLDARLRQLDGARDEEMLRYLARRAYRAEELYAPVVALFPDRRFSPIE